MQKNAPVALFDFATKICGTLSRKLQESDNEDIIKRYSLIFQRLSYSHLIELSKVENEIARQYYEALVQYAMPEKDASLFISKYKLQLPAEEELRDFIKKELQNL